MAQLMTRAVLAQENEVFRGTGGVSPENQSLGFAPAFCDPETGLVYRSNFADGRPAPFHLLDGLPESVVIARNAQGRVTRAKASLVSGFIRGQQFLTRAEASREAQMQAMYALAA